MYAQIKNLGKQSVVYGLGGVLTQVVGILLIPMYSRYLTPEDYGVIQLLLVTSGFLSIIMELGFQTALFRSVIYDSSENKQIVYSTAFYTLLFSALSILSIGGGFSGYISHLLFGTREYTYLVALMFITAALELVDVVPMVKLRIEGRSTQYSVINFSAFLCRVSFQILFIVVWHRGAAGSIEANVIQALLFTLVYLWIIKGELILHFSKKAATTLLKFGLPLIPVLLSGKILVLADRYFLARYSGLDEVGIYSMGYKIAMAVSLIVGAFQTAWPATLYAAAKKPDHLQFYARMMTYVVLVCGYVAVGLSVLAEDTLKILVAPEYFSAYLVVPLLSLSYVFYGAYFVSITGMQLHNRMHQLPYVSAIAAVFQCGINFLLVPRIGMMGAALSTAISYASMPILAVWFSRSYYWVKYEYQRILKIAVVGVVIYILSLFIQIDNIWISFMVRGFVAASFPLILYFLDFYSQPEKDRALHIFQQVKHQGLSSYFIKKADR